MIKSVNDIKFRASSMGYIMTDPRSKADGLLSETCKTHLLDVFASAMFSRREEVDNKFLRKGNECEEDAITLYSVVAKKYFIKNKQRLTDEHFTGEWDLHDSIKQISETTDIKTSWSLHTFLRATNKKLSDQYYWQGQTYMALTGAKFHTVAFCLVNGTVEGIEAEKRRLTWNPEFFEANGSWTEEGKKRAIHIEINHIFDMEAFKKKYPFYQLEVENWDYDIPKERRVASFRFERNDTDILRMRERVIECRNWIAETFKAYFLS